MAFGLASFSQVLVPSFRFLLDKSPESDDGSATEAIQLCPADASFLLCVCVCVWIPASFLWKDPDRDLWFAVVCSCCFP